MFVLIASDLGFLATTNFILFLELDRPAGGLAAFLM
jgi:hypothetical protein